MAASPGDAGFTSQAPLPNQPGPNIPGPNIPGPNIDVPNVNVPNVNVPNVNVPNVNGPGRRHQRRRCVPGNINVPNVNLPNVPGNVNVPNVNVPNVNVDVPDVADIVRSIVAMVAEIEFTPEGFDVRNGVGPRGGGGCWSRWRRRTLLGRSTEPSGRTLVTVRLWDEQVAAAYRESFDEFSRTHPDIDVRVNVVSYATYFDTLRTDVAGSSADDIFWVSNAYFANYADSGRLMDIANVLGPTAKACWEPSVVDQSRHDDHASGVGGAAADRAVAGT